MILPVVIYFIIFSYMPMGGLIIAFENFRPAKGILGSDFVGLKNFTDFFKSIYFTRVLSNTVIISWTQSCHIFSNTDYFCTFIK